MVESSSNSFIIRKSTFIVKNQNRIDDVYDVSSKILGKGTYGEVKTVKHL